MPQPTPAMTHVDKFLTNMSFMYLQNPNNFIADKVFPVVPVKKQSDLYVIYNQGDFWRDEMKEREGAQESAGGGYTLSSASYYAKEYSFHKDVTDFDRANSDEPLDADQDAVQFVTEKAQIKREILWRDNFFTNGVWTTDLQGVAAGPGAGEFLQWDAALGIPVSDIATAKLGIESLTGKLPNCLVLGPWVYEKLKDNAQLLERIQYGGTPGSPAVINLQTLATVFEVDRVLVARGVINSAAEGVADSINYMFGKHAFLCYTESAPGKKKAVAGKTFAWTGLLGANALGGRINRIPMPLKGIGTERIEIDMAFAQKVVAPALGAFFKDAVA